MHLGRCISSGKRPRMRRKRLHMSTTTLKRPPGDLRITNRQDSTDAPAMVGSSISRHQEINFFCPQEVSHWSLWTSSEPNDTQTTSCAFNSKQQNGFSDPRFAPVGASYTLIIQPRSCTLIHRVTRPLGRDFASAYSINGCQSYPGSPTAELGCSLSLPTCRATSQRCAKKRCRHCCREASSFWRRRSAVGHRRGTVGVERDHLEGASGVLAFDESRRWRGGF